MKLTHSKEFWERQSKRNLFKFLSKVADKKCLWCKSDFREGLIKDEVTKHMGMFDKETNRVYFVSGEAMVHFKTTHGYGPEILFSMLEVDEFNKTL